MATSSRQIGPAARIRQWLLDGDSLKHDARAAETGRGLTALVSDLHGFAVRAANTADACRRLERELRGPVSASLCKQQWGQLVEQSGLEELVAAGPTAGDQHGKPPDHSVLAEAFRLEGHLRRATADLAEATATVGSLVESLTEPPQPEGDSPLLPASVVELPPALAGQLARRLALLEENAGRIRWLYDRLLDCTVDLVFNGPSPKAES